jgi:hypothetical protein
MKLKSILAKPFASYIVKDIHKWSREAKRSQEFIFNQLLLKAKNTRFGIDHDFKSISTYKEYISKVPLREYEDFIPYIDLIKKGEENILWKGLPIYFAKSSGTTAGVKYIPITGDSVSNHINSARNALLLYIAESGNAKFVDGKMIFLSGSPVMENIGKILTGRLSGIVNHHVPKYLRSNQLPSYETNCIDDWETKVDAIVEETYNQNMTLISGIPPWIQMYFDKLLLKTGKQTIKEIFPNLQLLVYGGVNFQPYRDKIFSTIGNEIDSIETYPASEGFIAYQDTQEEAGLLLNVDSGIFFEFVPLSEVHSKSPTRLRLHDVELDKQYAIVLSSNAGLWSYVIGDTVKFISKTPYRILVTGRIKHFISAFGEHVIAEEVDEVIAKVSKEMNTSITEFTVAPEVNPINELPYHEWFIEFDKSPTDINLFRHRLDELLQKKNIYYRDLIEGKILQTLKISELKKDSFINFMRDQGKLGGQNKLPRLKNDRSIADELVTFKK